MKIIKKIFLLLLFDFVILTSIKSDFGVLSMINSSLSSSLHNITNYNPLIELKLFKNDEKLNSIANLADKKKHFKNEQYQQKDDLVTHESRAKEYLTINEIPDTAHSAYASVVHRGNQVMVNPFLAKKVGLSTLVAGTLFYSFTILPLILMLTGTGPFHEYGPLIRRKRSVKEKKYSNFLRYGVEHFELPMLTKFESNKFIQLYENTLELKRIEYPACKKLYFCKIYSKVRSKNEKPTTYYTFEDTLLNVLGIAVEKKTNKDFINECKFYYEPALIGISGQACENFYQCNSLILNN